MTSTRSDRNIPFPDFMMTYLPRLSRFAFFLALVVSLYPLAAADGEPLGGGDAVHIGTPPAPHSSGGDAGPGAPRVGVQGRRDAGYDSPHDSAGAGGRKGRGGPAVCSDPPLVDTVVARVNDRVITLAEVDREVERRLARLPAEKRSDPRLKRKLRREVTFDRIREVVYLQEAERVIEEEVKKRVDMVVDNIIKSLVERAGSLTAFQRELAREGSSLEERKKEEREKILIRELLRRKIFSRIVVSPDEKRSYYEEHIEEFRRPEEVHLRQIYLDRNPRDPGEVEKTLRLVREALARGEDFAELARRHSQGPKASRGGDWGWIARGTLLPEVEKAAFSLAPGEVSGIIRSSIGFHLVKVEGHRLARVLPYEEVEREIEQTLWKRKRDRREKVFLQELLGRSRWWCKLR